MIEEGAVIMLLEKRSQKKTGDRHLEAFAARMSPRARGKTAPLPCSHLGSHLRPVFGTMVD